jgi:hypothetical protein
VSFDQDDEGFILRRRVADGGVTAIRMSEQELLTFKVQLSLWFDRKMSEFQADTGHVQPIVVHPIAQVRLVPDAVQENVWGADDPFLSIACC